MALARLVGGSALLPVVKRYLAMLLSFTKRVEPVESLESAGAHVRSSFPAEPHHHHAD